MRRAIETSLLALVAGLSFACSGETSDANDESSALTNASIPQSDREAFKPIVSLNGRCTATKVGKSHFITAAHCVMSNEGLWRPGAEIAVEMSNYRDTVIKRIDRQRWPTVEKVTIDQRWKHVCENARYRSSCQDIAFTHEALAPDVALIVVQDIDSTAVPGRTANKSVRDMPSMPVLARTTKVGEALTLGGYGCTGENEGPSWLKVYEIRVGDSTVLDTSRSPQNVKDDFARLSDHFFFSDAKVALCPGDSGGPALVKKPGGGYAVAGIHAGYTFDAANKVIANWHTRVDSSSKVTLEGGGSKSTIDWLEAQGVEVAR